MNFNDDGSLPEDGFRLLIEDVKKVAKVEREVAFSEVADLTILMTASNMKEVIISDEQDAPASKQRGATVTISELHKDYRSLTSDAGVQELTEIFALYLTDYKDVSIILDSTNCSATGKDDVYL